MGKTPSDCLTFHKTRQITPQNEKKLIAGRQDKQIKGNQRLEHSSVRQTDRQTDA